jgi:hypothetical protein
MNAESPLVDVTLPLRLVNGSNEREHWSVRCKRTAEQRAVTHMRVRAELSKLLKGTGPLPPMKSLIGRAMVTIIRIGVRRLDSDGAVISAKPIRDGVADALGLDDGDKRIAWRYGQAHGSYAVRVIITSRPEGP